MILFWALEWDRMGHVILSGTGLGSNRREKRSVLSFYYAYIYKIVLLTAITMFWPMFGLSSAHINIFPENESYKQAVTNCQKGNVPTMFQLFQKGKSRTESCQKMALDLSWLVQLSGLSQYSHFYFQGWMFYFWESGWGGEPVWVYDLQMGEIKPSEHYYKFWSLVKEVAMKIRKLVRELEPLNELVWTLRAWDAIRSNCYSHLPKYTPILMLTLLLR